MYTTILREIIAFFIGYRYYANIVNTRGTDRCEICSFIFRSKKEAMEHRHTLASTRSFLYLQTISFRSRRRY